jgi:hypothetical protein
MRYGRRMRSWWTWGLSGIWFRFDLYQFAEIGGLLKLDRFSISIMETLSFRKAIYRVTGWVRWVWGGMRSAWLIQKFYFSPTEENLLISFWVDHAHYRRVLPKKSVYDFLDSRVRYMEDSIINPDGRRSVRTLERSLFKALQLESVRKIVVDFLESPSPKENYRPVMEAIRSAWRMADEVGVATGGEDEQGGQERGKDGSQGNERLLNARAYIIAVQLSFELAGKELEFGSFSQCLPDLKSFIRERFGVKKLPGRLEEFKGYSYKSELNGRNGSKRGQLRIPFRQIMQHPEVFGEDVSARARAMLKEYFPDR